MCLDWTVRFSRLIQTASCVMKMVQTGDEEAQFCSRSRKGPRCRPRARTTHARATSGTCSSHGLVWAHTCQALASRAGVCVEAGIRPQADTQTASGQTVLSSARGPGRVCDWLRLFCPPTAGVLVEPGWFSACTADGLVPTALADIGAWAPGSLEAKGAEAG